MSDDFQRQLDKLAAYSLSNQLMITDLMRVLTEDEGVNPVRCAEIVRQAADTAFGADEDGYDPHKAERESLYKWASVHEKNFLGK